MKGEIWCKGIFFLIPLIFLVIFEAFSLIKRFEAQQFLESIIPVACEPLDENDGSLVHIDCPLTGLTDFDIPPAFVVNLPNFRGIFLEMKAEMYQNALQLGFFTFGFTGVWSDHILPQPVRWPWSPRVEATTFFPNIPGSGRRFAPEIFGGGYLLDTPHLVDFQKKAILPLKNDTLYAPPKERPPTHLNSRNTRVYNDMLYTGDPEYPEVGDMRVYFYGSTATHVSAIGVQTKAKWSSGKTSLGGYPNPFGAPRNQTVMIEGDSTPEALVDGMRVEHDMWTPLLVPARLLMGMSAWIFYYSLFARGGSGSGGSLSAKSRQGVEAVNSLFLSLATIFLISGGFTVLLDPLLGCIKMGLAGLKAFGAFFVHFICRSSDPSGPPPGVTESTYIPLIDQTINEVELQRKNLLQQTNI